MYTINTEKINGIKKEEIINPDRYINSRKMTKEVLEKALADALIKIDKLWDDVHGNFPSEASKNNIYEEVENIYGWNEGFFTGMLWLAYEATGDEKYKERALSQIPSYEVRIDNHLGTNTHDMGFIYIPSCIAAYKLEGDEQGRRAALKAADHLLTRYIDAGKFIQAWGDVGTQLRLIIDCMNNIPLLFWAAEETGDNNYYEKAYNHAVTTINNIVREDASTHHTYFFKPDGTPEFGKTQQGAGDDSCWARGQAWIVSGLPYSYRYTKEKPMLELFEKVANYYINRLPNDFVPYWDLSFADGSNEEKDSSSGAIAVCGLLEMIPNIEDATLREIYEGVADKMMYSLYTNYSTKDTPDSNGLLLHAVYSKPSGDGVDECNIWGCYYYMEALVRMLKGTKAYW
ncbi:MAG: glycoside hydrolase family 88 protein [Clostridia bacterium]|nr:glycoside hydrolase family 88 protein [Clostridia bacterium]